MNQLINFCFSGRSQDEVKKILGRQAGMFSYLGTTDEDYQGDLNDVNCNRTELDFLLEGANSGAENGICARKMWWEVSPVAVLWWAWRVERPLR